MTLWGSVKSVNDQIAEVQFTKGLPDLFSLLSDASKQIVLEVVQSATEDSIYCLVLKGGELLSAGLPIKNTHTQLTIPAGKEVLGRVINVFGEPEDAKPLTISKRVPLHQRSIIELSEVVIPNEIQETGIKAIDFFAPLPKGGKLGLFGGAGLGKTVLLTELINNVVIRASQDPSDNKSSVSKKQRVSVFTAVGERAREAKELHLNLAEAGVLDHTALIVGQMGENPSVRFRTASAGVRSAEYFRDEGHDVLFFIDNMYRFAQAGYEVSTLMNMLPSEDGYQANLTSQVGSLHERLISTKSGSITTIEAIYLPSDDITDYSVRSVMPYLDSMVVLSRDIYQTGRLPAIDLLASNSSAMQPGFVSDKHYELYEACRQLLEKAGRLERIVSLIGENELSPENKTLYHRAQLLQNYMTQPFFSVEKQSSLKGEYVPLKQTLKDIESLLAGSFDTRESSELLMVGAVS